MLVANPAAPPKPATEDKNLDTSNSPRCYSSGIFPIRAYNHLLALIVALFQPIICVFCASYIEYCIAVQPQTGQYYTFNVIFYGISILLFVLVGLWRIVTYSAVITVRRKGKHVPIIGKIKTLKLAVKLEVLSPFIELLGIDFGCAVIFQFDNKAFATVIVPTLITLVTVVLMAFLIPEIHVQLTSSIFNVVVGVMTEIFLITYGAIKEIMIIAAYSIYNVALALDLVHSYAARYNVQTKHHELVSLLIPKSKMGFRGMFQILVVISIVLFYAQCFYTLNIPLFAGS